MADSMRSKRAPNDGEADTREDAGSALDPAMLADIDELLALRV